MSHNLQHKLNPSQNGFSEVKSTTTNLIIYLGLISVQFVLNVKLILYNLTLAVHLASSLCLFCFTNFVLMGLTMVM